MTVIRLAKHVLYRCPPGRAECAEGRCMFCEGGLSMCVICGGAECTLPTDCPGERMSEDTERQITAGTLDFLRRDGWVHILPMKGLS